MLSEPFGTLTVSTGIFPARSTLSVTLPKAHRLMPERPCVDIAIMSALISSAALIISSAGLPILTLVLTMAPLLLKLALVFSRYS